MSDHKVTISLGPLAQYFKRRADFFENEATQMAILLEQSSKPPVEPPPELVEDTSGTEPFVPHQSHDPYVMAPEGAAATPVTPEANDGVPV